MYSGENADTAKLIQKRNFSQSSPKDLVVSCGSGYFSLASRLTDRSSALQSTRQIHPHRETHTHARALTHTQSIKRCNEFMTMSESEHQSASLVTTSELFVSELVPFILGRCANQTLSAQDLMLRLF